MVPFRSFGPNRHASHDLARWAKNLGNVFGADRACRAPAIFTQGATGLGPAAAHQPGRLPEHSVESGRARFDCFGVSLGSGTKQSARAHVGSIAASLGGLGSIDDSDNRVELPQRSFILPGPAPGLVDGMSQVNLRVPARGRGVANGSHLYPSRKHGNSGRSNRVSAVKVRHHGQFICHASVSPDCPWPTSPEDEKGLEYCLEGVASIIVE